MHQIDGCAEFPLETQRTTGSRSGAAERSFAGWRRRQWVAEVVETEASPRRLDAHAAKSARASDRSPPCPADPEKLVVLLREGRTAEVCAAIESRLRSGVDPQTIMIEDLTPVAQGLGRLWDADECDIVDVSLGLGVLHNVLRDMAPIEPAPPAAPSIVILPTPGETHALGADMVASFFRSAGWRTARSDSAGFLLALKRNWYDAIGFSLSCERYVDSLQRAVIGARAVSRNPAIKVLVGGAIFGQKPEIAKNIGADLFAANAEAAMNMSRILLEELV
jgi:methanogenic corrinoid protein MtbC1